MFQSRTGLWKMENFCSPELKETVNARRRPLTEITSPLYNPMPLLYGGDKRWSESAADQLKSRRDELAVSALSLCVLMCTGISSAPNLLSHPSPLSCPITNQHSAAWEPGGRTEASALTCSASRSPLAPFHVLPEHLRSSWRCCCSLHLTQGASPGHFLQTVSPPLYFFPLSLFACHVTSSSFRATLIILPEH